MSFLTFLFNSIIYDLNTITSDELIIVPKIYNRSFEETCELYGALPADINSMTLPVFTNQLRKCGYESAGFSKWNGNFGEYILFSNNIIEIENCYAPRTNHVFCRKRLYYGHRNEERIEQISESKSLCPLITALILAKNKCQNQNPSCNPCGSIKNIVCSHHKPPS